MLFLGCLRESFLHISFAYSSNISPVSSSSEDHSLTASNIKTLLDFSEARVTCKYTHAPCVHARWYIFLSKHNTTEVMVRKHIHTLLGF